MFDPQRREAAQRVRPGARWLVVAAATVVSTFALEIGATAAGAVLAASAVFDGAPRPALLTFLVATYVVWIVGLRVNVIANWRLLEQTGTSTNLASKAMFELVRRRSRGQRVARAASAVGYVALEIAKEAPYYLAAFGTALLSDSVDSDDALLFLAGTNLGAAVYEYGVARLSRTYLDRRSRAMP